MSESAVFPPISVVTWKKGEHYPTKKALDASISQKDAQAITKRLLEILTEQGGEYPFKDAVAVHFNGGLGILPHALLTAPKTPFTAGCYIFEEGKTAMLERNLEVFGLDTSMIQVQTNYETGTLNGLQDTPHVVVADLDGALSYMDDMGKLLQELVTWKNARVIVLCLPKGHEPISHVGMLSEHTTLNRREVVFLYENRKTENQWRRSLENFLRSLLSTFVKPEHMELYFTQAAWSNWERAFTQRSFDPNNNNELLEFLGDRMIEAAATCYLQERFPQLDQRGLSFVKSAHVDKPFLRWIADTTGFPRHLRYKGGLTIHMKEDSMEAFVGALSVISDEIQDGFGYVQTRAFINVTYNKIDISLEEAKGPPSMVVPQTFTQLKMVTPKTIKKNVFEEAEEDPKTKRVKAKIRVSQQIRRAFTNHNISIPEVLGQGSSNEGAKMAIKNAYKDALAFLRSAGVTDEWVQSVRRPLEFRFPSTLQKMHSDLKAKAQSMGYVDIDIQKSTTMVSRYMTTVNLIGVKIDGTEDILASGSAAKIDDAKMNAANEFLKL